MTESTLGDDVLVRLRATSLGPCASCGESVLFAHNFLRFKGRVIHVCCSADAHDEEAGHGHA